jgi:ribonuclease P protein component
MAFGFGCVPGPDAPSSSGVASRVAVVSLPRAVAYVSLRSAADVGRVRKVGTRRRVGGIVVFAATRDAGPARLAFVAGRSVGNAVRRNRAKRRLREAVRRVPVRTGYDFVVIATPVVVDAPFETLVTWARRALTEEGE